MWNWKRGLGRKDVQLFFINIIKSRVSQGKDFLGYKWPTQLGEGYLADHRSPHSGLA